MAVPLQWMPHVVSLLFLLLGLCTLVSSGELEMIDRDAPELSCSEGLTDCYVSSGYQFCAALTDPSGTANVAEVQLEVVLCCPARQDCKLCLQIIIILQEVHTAVDVSGESGDDSDDEACVKVLLSSPGAEEVCKALWFKPSYSSSAHPSEQSTHKLLLTEKVEFGSPVEVLAHSKETQYIQNITIPSLGEVCSMERGWAVKECNVPKLRVDPKKNVVLLQLENTDSRQDELMWQMVWNGSSGEVLVWPKGQTEMVVPSNYVAPCLCFKVWWKGKKELQRKHCPFENQQDALERMQYNVSVSVVEAQMRTGEAGLRWNVTAPCRLEAEVWLCKKNLARDQCEEVTGSRQRLQAGWSTTRSGHWVKTLKSLHAELKHSIPTELPCLYPDLQPKF